MYEDLSILAILSVVLYFIFFLGVAFTILSIIGKWKLFEKCGKEGWRALIPFYSGYTLVEISGLNIYWFLLYIFPYIIGFISKNSELASLGTILRCFAIAGICYNLSKKFKKGDYWFILSIFIAGITVPLLGYMNKDKYYKTEKVEENAFLQSLFNKKKQ